MKLAHPQLETVIEFEKNKINSIVIENPDFLRKFLKDIQQQTEGITGETVLSEHDIPIDFSKNAELIDSFVSFEIGKKALINKICAKLVSVSVDESHLVRTAEVINILENYIHDLSYELPCDLCCEKMSIESVIKSVGICIPNDYENDLEKILDYMEIVRSFERDKLFIFVNMRSFYNDSDIEKFMLSALSHEYIILLIDSCSKRLLPEEQRLTIDADLCEF